MTAQEMKLLQVHNLTFTKPAVSATILEYGRFYVTYANGLRKWDYYCGSSASDLRKAVGI
jgi:hypothetical protein